MSKKLFVMALGAFLVIAFAAGAYAETKVSFNGEYRIRGWYRQNLNVANDTDNEDKAAYFDHRWELTGRFMPNENVTFNFRGRTNEDQVWGGAAPVTGATAGVMTFDRLYMDVKTKYGLWTIGLQEGGIAGLAVLGWKPAGLEVFDSSTDSFRVRFIVPPAAG